MEVGTHKRIPNLPKTNFYIEVINSLGFNDRVIKYRYLDSPFFVGTIEGGILFISKAFLDLEEGLSVSMLSYITYTTLALPPYKLGNIRLELAYGSNVLCRGVV